ncbi:hypothetical protein Pmani_007523 [Petrolisthes manimaculis]|uniref:Uncharacterized protein n=1 Tax=Petrolisthes manimaculis TaxID=1843537 RepID=A0AAE1Q873_9EUCA|nr:hypothetical protein Pmani_007523 [Petrolisthes manimaculis]
MVNSERKKRIREGEEDVEEGEKRVEGTDDDDDDDGVSHRNALYLSFNTSHPPTHTRTPTTPPTHTRTPTTPPTHTRTPTTPPTHTRTPTTPPTHPLTPAPLPRLSLTEPHPTEPSHSYSNALLNSTPFKVHLHTPHTSHFPLISKSTTSQPPTTPSSFQPYPTHLLLHLLFHPYSFTHHTSITTPLPPHLYIYNPTHNAYY